ncbi:hypothetical protein V2J09_013420 [Rumex salicifolius]
MSMIKMTKKERTNPSTTTEKTLAGIGNLIKLLPTGTVFAFQFLSPLVTNNGHCHPVNKALTGILLAVCGFSCAFSCFTDSYTGPDGARHYAVATRKGLWPSPEETAGFDSSRYRLRPGDFVHAFFAIIVFCVLVVLDKNSVECFVPGLEASNGMMLMVLPPAVGTVASTVFAAFPTTRHGIGYPSEDDSSS